MRRYQSSGFNLHRPPSRRETAQGQTLRASRDFGQAEAFVISRQCWRLKTKITPLQGRSLSLGPNTRQRGSRGCCQLVDRKILQLNLFGEAGTKRIFTGLRGSLPTDF
jgi:hypothetical protein